jgi:hypothetical protein
LQNDGHDSSNISKTGSSRLLTKKVSSAAFRVDTAVVEVSDKINEKGIRDNKKLQDKPTSEFYRTLVKENEERERLR